MSMLPIVLCEV